MSYWHEYLDLMFFFKAINGIITVPKEILPKRSVPSRPTRSSSINSVISYRPRRCKTATYQRSFFIRATRTWNSLQWRNVISGGPRFKIFEGPLVEAPKARVERCICTSFLGVRACSPGKFFNLDSLKCHFPDFGERFYRIVTVRKRHCDISEALTNVFALQPEPGGPHLAHWGWGPPGSPGPSA